MAAAPLPGVAAAAFALLLAASCGDAVAPRKQPTIMQVRFPTVVVPGTSAAVAVEVPAELHLPAGLSGRRPAVVIVPSSSGVQAHRERYYAAGLAGAGYVALIVDSFAARGVESAIEDQSSITSYQLEADAFGALAYLRAHPAVMPDAVALMGGSKGGTASLNSVFLIREAWRRTSARFSAHVAITPDCSVPHRSAATTGAPLLLMLAEEDDYTPPAPCVAYADRMARTGASVQVHVVEGTAHGWERLQPVQWIATAENFSGCGGIMEDDGRITVEGLQQPLGSAAYLAWARESCVTRGAHVGGGTPALRDAATGRIHAFLLEALGAGEPVMSRAARN